MNSSSMSRQRRSIPITKNEKEEVILENKLFGKSKNDNEYQTKPIGTSLFDDGFEDMKQKKAYSPHRKQGLLIPSLHIEVIDEGSNP